MGINCSLETTKLFSYAIKTPFLGRVIYLEYGNHNCMLYGLTLCQRFMQNIKQPRYLYYIIFNNIPLLAIYTVPCTNSARSDHNCRVEVQC